MLDEQEPIRQFLEAHNTATIATLHGDRPWAGAVFYANDEALNLYFKTDPTTWRGKDIAINPHVAATIQDDGQRWTEIRGLQISGECRLLAASEERRVHDLYLDKFSFLQNAEPSAADPKMRVVADRLATTPYYCLKPQWIRLIDNARGFGHKNEVQLSD